MARMTDASIAALKPKAARYEVSDPQQRGLRVAVYPTGRRTFIVRYRYAGRPRKLTLQPGINVSQARKLASDALFQVSQGTDPAVQHTAKRRAADTVEHIAEEFLARHEGKLRSAGQYGDVLKRLVLPELGQLPISSVRRRDVSRLLDKVEDSSGPSMAHTTLAVVRRLFAWHAARSDDFNSPIVRGMGRIKASERQRERILSDDEIARVWKAAEADNSASGPYIRFLLLTACRRNEAACLTWDEINGPLWTLPAERNKTKRPLERPLSAAALAAISRAPRLAGSNYVFTSTGGRFYASARRKSQFDKASETSGWTLHDLRRTARSLLSRAGVPTEHAERCLGHVSPIIQQTYDRHKYIAEMAVAYEKLATLIQQIVDPQPNVVALQSRIGA
jgi:integrase